MKYESSLPLEELVDMYGIANQCLKEIKTGRVQSPWSERDVIRDMDELYKAMEQKIPASHEFEIEKIREKLSTPPHGIKPGNQYRHRMIGILRVEVVQQDEITGLWMCRQFVGKLYSNRVQMRSSIIVEHYSRIKI